MHKKRGLLHILLGPEVSFWPGRRRHHGPTANRERQRRGEDQSGRGYEHIRWLSLSQLRLPHVQSL